MRFLSTAVAAVCTIGFVLSRLTPVRAQGDAKRALINGGTVLTASDVELQRGKPGIASRGLR